MSKPLNEYERTRCQARKVAYDCYMASGPYMPAAIAEFNRQWNKQRDEDDPHYIRDVRSFIVLAVWKANNLFSWRTVPPPGPQPKAPKQVIEEAGGIIAAGHMQQCTLIVDNQRYDYVEHRQFTSLKNARQLSQRLGQIMKEYSMSTEYLRKKLHQYCPRLVYHTLRMRQSLKTTTLKERSSYGEDMLFRLRPNPEYLIDVHFMDECTIWIGKDLISDRLHVWSYRNTKEGEQPAPNPLFIRGRSFKVNLLLVVSGRNGCDYAEILSGTQGLNPTWRDSLGMQLKMLERNNIVYQTTRQNEVYDAKGGTREELYDNCLQWVPYVVAQAQGRRNMVAVQWDNASIHNFKNYRGSYAGMNITEAHYIEVPPYSPDLQQPVEHCFARLKQDVVVAMYNVGWINVTPEWVARWVLDWCWSIPAAAIQADLQHLPELYWAVTTPKGQSVVVDGKSIQGTGGGYAKGGIS